MELTLLGIATITIILGLVILHWIWGPPGPTIHKHQALTTCVGVVRSIALHSFFVTRRSTTRLSTTRHQPKANRELNTINA